MTTKINLNEKYSQFSDHWHPRILGHVNQHELRIAKVEGDFEWHQHDDTDEFFLVVAGTLMMDFRDHTETVYEGEVIIVPKGTEHRPRTTPGEEVRILMFEASGTLNTGNNHSKRTKQMLEKI